MLVEKGVWLVESVWPRVTTLMPLRSRFARSRPLSPRKGTDLGVLARVRSGPKGESGLGVVGWDRMAPPPRATTRDRPYGFVAREGIRMVALRGSMTLVVRLQGFAATVGGRGLGYALYK